VISTDGQALPLPPTPSLSVLRWCFDGSDSSVPVARRWARTVAITMLGAEEQTADDVALVVSELAANALRHAHTAEGFTVRLRGWGGGVRVEVADRAPGFPALDTTPCGHAESGRGLRLVDAVSASWGWYTCMHMPGKVVFAHLGGSARREHVARLFSPPDPRPEPGCGRCADLVQRRAAARHTGDRSRASDLNVLMRRHQVDEH